MTDVLDDLTAIADVVRQQGRAIAEALGELDYLKSKLENAAMTTADLETKIAALTAKLTAYEKQVADAKASEDATVASQAATIAANQAIVDSLNAKVADLTTQLANAGVDLTGPLAEIQADIDGIPLEPVVAPAQPDTTAAATTGA